MPKTRPLTREEQEKQEREAMAKRIRIIANSYRDNIPIYEVAEVIHVSPSVLQRRWNGSVDWDVPTLIRVCDALGVPDIERARMLGGGKR